MKSVIQLWKASRPYSYPAAIVPVLLGTATAKRILPSLKINWFDFVLVLLGCILTQAISNLVNDLIDFKTGVDHAGVPGRKSALVSGDLSENQMLNGTIVIGIVATAIGAYFALKIGLPILLLALVGGILAIEYTAPPLKLKYHGLGDITVLFTFGIGMLFGAYMVQTHNMLGWLAPDHLVRLALYGLPSGLLVVAILQTNNHRDREKDAQLGGKTVANSLPVKVSKGYLFTLLIVPYCIVLAMVATRYCPWYELAVVLTLPGLIKLYKLFLNNTFEGSVALVAKLHGQFGVLMMLAVVAEILLR